MYRLLSVLLLAGTSLAAPSLSSRLDGLSLVPASGQLDLRSLDTSVHAPGLEIRGVVGGRKKRYIIVRANENNQCCNGAPSCNKAQNEYRDQKDCSCKKCPAGQKPNAQGTKCEKDGQDSCNAKRQENGECCPKGQKKDANGKCVADDCPTGQKKDASGKCVADDDCPTGQKKDASGKCQPSTDNKNKQGKCKAGEILDPAEGGQDEKTEKPVCVPDDSKKCKAGEVPATRMEGDKDPKSKVDCGKEPSDKDKAKCDPKRQYVEVQVQPTLNDGNKAVEFCKRTRDYERKKKKKVNDIKPKKQKKWDDEKPEREKKKKEEEEKRKKEEEEKKKKQEQMKKDEQDGRKKTRMGRCLPLGAFLDAGMAQISAKKRGEPEPTYNNTIQQRDGIDSDNPWEWTTEYFDEDFLKSDELLKMWPSDVEWNENVDIDNDDFVKYYTDAYQKHLDDIQREELRTSGGNCPGSRKRCTAKRAVETAHRRVQLTERDTVEITGRGSIHINEDGETVERLINERGERVEYLLNARGERLEKRIWPIISLIASFLLRAAQIAVRFIPRIAQVSTRLGNILKDEARLFRVAAPGRGASMQGMRTAAQRTLNSRYFKSCLKGGKPT